MVVQRLCESRRGEPNPHKNVQIRTGLLSPPHLMVCAEIMPCGEGQVNGSDLIFALGADDRRNFPGSIGFRSGNYFDFPKIGASRNSESRKSETTIYDFLEPKSRKSRIRVYDFPIFPEIRLVPKIGKPKNSQRPNTKVPEKKPKKTEDSAGCEPATPGLRKTADNRFTTGPYP